MASSKVNSGGTGSINATRSGSPFGPSFNYNWKKQNSVDYNQIVNQSLNKGIQSNDYSVCNMYYLPTELLSFSDVENISKNWSKDINLENMIYYTTKGWTIEKLKGWNREYDAQGNILDEHYKINSFNGVNAYYGYAYSLYYSEIGGKRDQVRPSNNPKSWSILLWTGHPHPFDSPPSQQDRDFSFITGTPVYTWGWAGNNSVTYNKLIFTLNEYLYFNSYKSVK